MSARTAYFSFRKYPIAMFFLAFILTACGGGGGGEGNLGAVCTPITGVVFVNTITTGTGDGTCWANAFTTVQAGVDAAVSGNQVWVKQGTYKAAANNASVLIMKDGVAVYGGFAGSETAVAQRPFPLAETVLSGDLTGDGFTADDSYHVVVGASNARLDGFAVSGGNAVGSAPDNSGAGMYNATVSALEVANVTFRANTATNGGGMYNNVSSPSVSNVIFNGNAAGQGGGMYNTASSPTVSNVSFGGNTAVSGGGMFNTLSSNPTVSNVSFSGNSAVSGGGMNNALASSATVSNVSFRANTASGNGGGMYHSSNTNPTVSNVTFSGNSAANGGGMYSSLGSATVTNVSFSGNSASGDGGGMYITGGSPTVTNGVFWGNTTAGSHADIAGTATVDYTCSQQDLTASGTNDITLTASPFVGGVDGELFLDQYSPCVNSGSDAAATSAGLSWITLTTSWWGNTDSGTVDRGRHYAVP